MNSRAPGSNDGIEVLLAKPRGFCAGVDRAIAIVERALEIHGAPIYVRHEIVHNKFVVDDLRAKGAVFVEELDEVPAGATVIFSAHGVGLDVRREADARGLKVFDATCPLVTKVHVEVAKMREAGREVVMIGHEGHPESEGTMGQSTSGMYLVESEEDVAKLDVTDPERLAYVTQTTLSIDDCERIVAALKVRFPAIVGPKKDDICYATQNRQDAVKLEAGMGGMGGGMMGGETRLANGLEFNILKLTAAKGAQVALEIPARLSTITSLKTSGLSPRRITLSLDRMQWLINGQRYRSDSAAFDVRRAVEVWDIENSTNSMIHPMHLHGFSFQVVGRSNSPTALRPLATASGGRVVTDLGWKDTVMIFPGETVRIAVDFRQAFPGEQLFLFHCHNLEHEDGNMMINFRIQA